MSDNYRVTAPSMMDYMDHNNVADAVPRVFLRLSLALAPFF